MSMQKQLLFSAAALLAVSGLAFAGGPDEVPATSDFSPAIYVDLNGGYDFYDYSSIQSNVQTPFAGVAGNITNHNGGFAGGLDIGYQFLKNLGIEIGGYYLPYLKGASNVSTTVGTNTAGSNNQTSYQYNWMAYSAVRVAMDVPGVSDLSVFAKVGAMWRAFYLTNSTVTGMTGDNDYWDVVYGLGLNYDIEQTGFSANLQWLNLPSYLCGNDKAGGTITRAKGEEIATRFPTQNLLTLGLGYKFAI